MRFPRFRLFAALTLCLPLAACLSTTKWEPVPEPVSPRDYIEQAAPERVRVLLSNGVEAEVIEPMIRNDSLVGLSPGGGRVSLAVRDVRGLAKQSYQPGAAIANLGLGVVYFFGALSLWIAIMLASGGGF